MCAIRESKDPVRTMDAFWRGQMKSKEWLIRELKNNKQHYKLWPNIDIHGGWVGTLASMLFQSDMYINHINSIDIDPTCEATAKLMNQLEYESGKFNAFTADMCIFRSDADIIINTSCEHITQDDYDLWLTGMPQNSLLVLQSNNYNIPEHVRTAKDLTEFKEQCHINVLWAGELETQLYTRYMIIGKQ
jgi:hypothetical protein